MAAHRVRWAGPVVNSRLSQLQPYPFEKLRALLAGLTPAGRPIPLSIGEPQHATPELVRRAITEHLDGLSSYPATAGHERVRAAIAAWFERRYQLKPLDPRTQVLPVNGTREALFAFGQAVIDPARANPVVVSPNPFYQIYEGAALLAGAEPLFLNQTEDTGFALDLDSLTHTAVGAHAVAVCVLAGQPVGPRADARRMASAVRPRGQVRMS